MKDGRPLSACSQLVGVSHLTTGRHSLTVDVGAPW